MLTRIDRMEDQTIVEIMAVELLERERQLEALDGWLRETATGSGRLVFVGGEAGVGKTTLVNQFCQLARDRARVVRGACDAFSTPRPFGPLLDIAEAVGGDLDRLLNEGASRDQIFRATLTELDNAPTPTLAVIEDAHWADEPTLDLLRYLGRRLEPVRAMLVVTYRDDEVGPIHPFRRVLGDLATVNTVRRSTIPTLSLQAVQALAAETSIDPVALHRQTGGNPFYVTEVLASGASGIPTTVSDAVLTRSARLSSAGRVALDVAAVIGGRIDPWLLDQTVGSDVNAIDECLMVGLLTNLGGNLAFRHELAREAILATIAPGRARDIHTRVLTALRSRPIGPDDLLRCALHADGAGDVEAVLAFAPSAAERAAELGAHRQAAGLYSLAYRSAQGATETQRAVFLEGQFREYRLTGRFAEAIAAANALIHLFRRTGDRHKEAETLARLAAVLVTDGRNAEAERTSKSALDLLATDPPSPSHPVAFYAQAALRMLDRDYQEAIFWGERAKDLAEHYGNVEVRVRALNALGSTRVLDGDEERGRADLELSLSLAREAGLDSDVASAFGNLGSVFGEVYRWSLAERYLVEGIAFETERELDHMRWYMQAWLSLTRLYQGRWSEAAELAGSVLRQHHVPTIGRITASVPIGRLRARRGDPDQTTVLDEALALAETTGALQRLAPVRAARAEAAWLAGDPARAAEEARAVLPLALRHNHPWYIGECAYWLARAGESIDLPETVAAPFAAQIAGDWHQAAELWRERDCPYEEARALAEGDDEDAVREAIATFNRLGARPAVAVATRRLRELGVREIPRGPRPATRANPAQLTNRQVEVLRLMASGSTNAEIATQLFLSAKTVEHHVSAILTKLDVPTRRDAIRAANALGLLPQDKGSSSPR